jgi:Yip1 domain
LIFRPAGVWERIAETRRGPFAIFVRHFAPMLLIFSLVEGWGLMRWGKERGAVPHLRVFSQPETIVYESAQALLFMAIVLAWAWLIKTLGETFHGRHSFGQAFTVAAYGISPLFLLKLLDAFPVVSPWITWLVGILLVTGVLYHGIPVVMRPDPPHAIGLYLMSTLLLVMITGLARFVTAWYLRGKFGKLDALVSHFLGQ